MPLLPDKAALVAYNADPEQAAIDRAVALVENYICPGVAGILTATNRTVTLRLSDEARAFEVPVFAEFRISARRLKFYPITGLTNVTVDGLDITSECTFDRFGIVRSRQGRAISGNSSITVVFKTGFEDPVQIPATLIPLPSAIRQAILNVASTISANPNGVHSETRLGHEIVYNSDFGSAESANAGISGTGSGLPLDVIAMLAPYRLEVY